MQKHLPRLIASLLIALFCVGAAVPARSVASMPSHVVMSALCVLVNAGAAPLSCDPFVRRRLFETMRPSASSDEYDVSAGAVIICGAPVVVVLVPWQETQVAVSSG